MESLKMIGTEHIKIYELVDILKEFPDVKGINIEKYGIEGNCYIFLCALGFEDRCLNIPEKFAKNASKKFKRSLYFDYSANRKDNEINRKSLENYLNKFSEFTEKMNCCDDDFTYNLRSYLKKTVEEFKEKSDGKEKPKIFYDISVCSSQLILSSIRTLIDFDVSLEIVYTEAEIYHPTAEEFERESDNWSSNGGGHSCGVDKIVSVYSGIKEINLDLIVAFPTFKPERTQAIIMAIDESILLKENKKNIIWIIGDPNMELEEGNKRKKIMYEINEITTECKAYEISTLNYKKTIEILDRIFLKHNYEYHINISALGSKMQSLGIAIFSYLRPEITIYTAQSMGYNPNLYSEGCKEDWAIDFGDTVLLRELLNKIGIMEVRNNSKINIITESA